MVSLITAALITLGATTDFESIRKRVELDVALGFETRTELIRSAMSSAAESERGQVTAIVDDALGRHLAKQKTWKGRTDCDRLEAAFAALNRRGIIAREYFGMTSTSGRGAMKELLVTDKKLQGFVFYTPQDLENVFADEGVLLTLGAAAAGDDAHEAIALAVVGALKKEGLTPERAGLTTVWVPLKWQKRRKP
ncbi:MAG: hypothetical protein JNJ54_10535 [Myxococcaceae bacterium]|nr:hypothetical protein [Myxococcaceae bacterium]